MRKSLISIVSLALAMLPAAASAEQCRDSATGKFAKCGATGAVPASQYVAKTKMTGKTAHAAAKTKPGLPPTPKPKAQASPTPAAAKVARCKTPKGKFVKCGTPGAVPA